MTAETFLTLLFIFSTITSLVTEALKKTVTFKKIAIDVVVVGVAAVVGFLGMGCYYILNDITIVLKDGLFVVLMMLANALVAMVGYDKVVEAIKQITTNKEI